MTDRNTIRYHWEFQNLMVFFVRTPGKQPPCLYERIFAGQRTASGISRELPGYRGDWIDHRQDMQAKLEAKKVKRLRRNVRIIEDSDGNKAVMVERIIFKGKKAINWKDVKKYLENYLNASFEIDETADIIHIGKDMPDEYTGSKYTYSLRGSNAKANANAVQGIPEIIRIAHGKYHRDNSGKKHKRKAANGWYRYDSYFVLPVYGQSGGIERYNVFHCSLIIRHANDGKMYLYDIIDIKKETSNSFRFQNLT